MDWLNGIQSLGLWVRCKTVKQNVSKAQRATYSLMPVGLHVVNGLDPETSLHLIRIYVLPDLTYGLEIILLGSKGIQTLELCQKKNLRTNFILTQKYPRSSNPCINWVSTSGSASGYENFDFFQ